jgi:NADH:ubiquinone oxidoreductase subunit H
MAAANAVVELSLIVATLFLGGWLSRYKVMEVIEDVKSAA